MIRIEIYNDQADLIIRALQQLRDSSDQFSTKSDCDDLREKLERCSAIEPPITNCQSQGHRVTPLVAREIAEDLGLSGKVVAIDKEGFSIYGIWHGEHYGHIVIGPMDRVAIVPLGNYEIVPKPAS